LLSYPRAVRAVVGVMLRATVETVLLVDLVAMAVVRVR
jgi:hypothetical protein